MYSIPDHLYLPSAYTKQSDYAHFFLQVLENLLTEKVLSHVGSG